MAILFVSKIVVMSAVSLCVSAVSLEDFYPYGLSYDKQILTNDDGSSLRIDLDPPLRFYNQSYNGCYVSTVSTLSRICIRQGRRSQYGYSGFGRSRFWPHVLSWFASCHLLPCYALYIVLVTERDQCRVRLTYAHY